jgi:hypothetical protein
MLKQLPKLDITESNKFQVRAQVGQVKYHVLQAAHDIIAELDDHHHFEFDAQRLKFIHSLLADNKYLSPVAVTFQVQVEITLALLHRLLPD